MVSVIVRSSLVCLPAVLALFVLIQGADGSSKNQRHASIGGQSVDYRGEPVLAEDASVPVWLEELLTRVPESVADAGRVDPDTPGDQAVVNSEPDQPAPEVAASDQAPAAETEEVRAGQPVDIPPLYSEPRLEGEGVWISKDLPKSTDGNPLIYRTVYRPSMEYPNSTVYMAMFDMSRLYPRFFVGNTEPGIYQVSYRPENEDLARIVALTNAMWMQQHSRGAGAIFRGQVVYPMVQGMATMIIYRDGSVDIQEWSDDIPLSLVSDARQLRHLIVKDGKVVTEIVRNGKTEDSEIGLGGFLIDDKGRSTMANKDLWFLANRTAFGVREDGNLVFAMGHHVSTKDLGKALVLAGCKRAIHGDANIHNIVCNFYFRDDRNRIVQRDKLSPEQLNYTMKRYDQGYAKDFFAFYER